jgi:hypothetical protein
MNGEKNHENETQCMESRSGDAWKKQHKEKGDFKRTTKWCATQGKGPNEQ